VNNDNICSNGNEQRIVTLLYSVALLPGLKELKPFIGPFKPQSNNTVIGTLAVDGWAACYIWVWAGCGPAQSPPHCTKCNSPPINGQYTNFILFDVAL